MKVRRYKIGFGNSSLEIWASDDAFIETTTGMRRMQNLSVGDGMKVDGTVKTICSIFRGEEKTMRGRRKKVIDGDELH